MATTTPAFGTVEQIAEILRRNNPDSNLVDSRTVAVIKVLAEWGGPAAVRLDYVLNALTASEIVLGELAEAGR